MPESQFLTTPSFSLQAQTEIKSNVGSALSHFICLSGAPDLDLNLSPCNLRLCAKAFGNQQGIFRTYLKQLFLPLFSSENICSAPTTRWVPGYC